MEQTSFHHCGLDSPDPIWGSIFCYNMVFHGMAWGGRHFDRPDPIWGGSPDICGPGKSALNVGVQCSCPPFKNQMLQNFDKTYCLTSSNGPPLECIESILEVMETRGQTIKRSITRNKTCCRSHKSGDIHLSI